MAVFTEDCALYVAHQRRTVCKCAFEQMQIQIAAPSVRIGEQAEMVAPGKRTFGR